MSALRKSGPSLRLASNEPHEPASEEDSANEHGEALQAVVKLLFGRVLLGDPEDDRREEREDHRGREVGKGDGHGFFPSAMWWASAAAMKFSSPATMTKVLP